MSTKLSLIFSSVLIAVPAFSQLPLTGMRDDAYHGRQNALINFYGRVVDDAGNSLPGATVMLDFVYGEWAAAPVAPHQVDVRVRTEKTNLVSGKDGLFYFTNVMGHGIDRVVVSKPGYVMSKRAKSYFFYSSSGDIFHPDPNNPVEFRMWKEVGKEKLNHASWNGKRPSAGSTNRFDLLTGKEQADGLFSIKCTRVPRPKDSQARHAFGYSVSIEVGGAGIFPTDDEFTFRARLSGYLPEYNINVLPDDREWKPSFIHDFYVRTTDGHYGVLHIDWEAWQTRRSILKWECFINPSGSRNLER